MVAEILVIIVSSRGRGIIAALKQIRKHGFVLLLDITVFVLVLEIMEQRLLDVCMGVCNFLALLDACWSPPFRVLFVVIGVAAGLADMFMCGSRPIGASLVCSDYLISANQPKFRNTRTIPRRLLCKQMDEFRFL